MNDKKRLNAETPRTIRDIDVKAWARGKDDAKRNQLLKDLAGITPDKAISAVRMFAERGDEQFIRNKLSLSISDIRKILDKFGIKSIEDARKVVATGIIGDLDASKVKERDERATFDKNQQTSMNEKLQEHDKAFHDKKRLTTDEQDLKLAAAREEAFRKNKSEKLKELIGRELKHPVKNGFQIPLKELAAFKSMIPHGISQLQRRFGGTKADIVSEIKRLSPNTDIDMLRP